VKQAKEGRVHLYFFDPSHNIHNNYNGYEWQEKGASGTKVVKANTGRRRLNVIGGLNATTLNPYVFLTEANCNKELVSMYLEGLRKQHPDGKRIVLILDNAPYNHSYLVNDTAEKLNIKLEYLPPYCPNLNLIERLWKFLKKKVKTNNYCEHFEDFQNSILHFFENIQIYQQDLQSLLTLNFEIITAS
jgi:transposase